MRCTWTLGFLLGAVATPVVAQGGTATYELVFRSSWSAATHPVAFPPNPHFSPLIGGTHNGSVAFWQVGGTATAGMEKMAETGQTSPLDSEIQSAISAGTADQLLQFGGLGTSPASRTVQFAVNAEYPRLTLVSMLAPSPDWFVGVGGLELLQNGQWVDNLVVPLQVWDAGSDSGITYLAANQNTFPKDPIAGVSTTQGPFQGLPGPIGEFALRRLSGTLVYGCGTNPAGSMAVTGTPVLGGSVTLEVDDPGGTVAPPGGVLLLVSALPDPGFPCGTPLPGLGLAGAAGELLVQLPSVPLVGPPWLGAPVGLNLTVPNMPALLGAKVYLQGGLTNNTRAGLTDAVELLIG